MRKIFIQSCIYSYVECVNTATLPSGGRGREGRGREGGRERERERERERGREREREGERERGRERESDFSLLTGVLPTWEGKPQLRTKENVI